MQKTELEISSYDPYELAWSNSTVWYAKVLNADDAPKLARIVNSHAELLEALHLVAYGDEPAIILWLRANGNTTSRLSDLLLGQLRQLVAVVALRKAKGE